MPPFQTASFLILWDTIAEYLIMTDIVLIDSATVTGVAFCIGLLKNCKPPFPKKIRKKALLRLYKSLPKQGKKQSLLSPYHSRTS